ncbi:hypothetical protein ACJIZ3_012068 [Penstemon smallii]|uniref:F-box domain-containing protein n=1 Tax=Penstemon smallii TaxID=265156 RepID=A0ABD3UN32_9LAMI
MESKRPAGHKEDHFHRLPEELLLYIFSKLSDLNSLCRCLLVSKHFASVISRTQTISITLCRAHSFDSYTNICRFFSVAHDLHSEVEQTDALLELLSLQKLKLLGKFKELKSIYLEYAYPKEIDHPSSFLKWKIKCTSSSAVFESFIGLLSASVHKMTDEADDEQSSGESICPRINDCFRLAYGRYIEWLCLICMLAKSHDSLKSVRIADSEKHGNLVIRDGKIVQMRSCVLQKELKDNINRSLLELAWVPELRLPLSGYLMRDVGLFIVKVPTETCGNANKNDDMTYWDFDDEEKVFAEAVKEILINHRDRIIGD